MSSVAVETISRGVDPAQGHPQRAGVLFGSSAHRMVWSLLLVLAVTALRNDWKDLRRVLRDRRAILMLCGSTLLLSTNWFVFIYAVNSGHTVEASLGYFINPLF